MASHGLPFKEWALKEKAYYYADIAQIDGNILGIDAEEYLATLITQNREPLVPALGGLPLSLRQRVDDDLQRFKAANIRPRFVFNGLDLACRDRASILKESVRAADTLDSAWRIYDAGKGEEAVSAFGRACTYRTYHIVRSLMAHLNSKEVSIFVAPYSAAAQLVEFEREEHVTAIMGSASCLLFGAEKVLLEFAWDDKQFKHTDLEKCAFELGVPENAFSDVCLLCGYSILPTMPELDADTNIPRLEAAKMMLSRANNDGYAATANSKDEGYQMLFHKARLAVKHAVVMRVKTLDIIQDNWDSAPSDSHEFLGQRLPHELYYYMIRGLAGPRVLNWRTRMEILETPPLDGGLSHTYKNLVSNKLVPLRAQSMVIISHLLHRYYQKHDVDLVCWFNEDQDPKPLNIVDNMDSAKKANNWNVTQDKLPTPPDPAGPPLRYAIYSLVDENVAKRTKTPRAEGTPPHLSKQSELRPNVIWRFLEHRGYINTDHTLSKWGHALNAALHKATLYQTPLDREMEEAIFMAFELLRLGILNTTTMFNTPPYSGPPIRGTETDKKNNLLISRIACLGTFRHESIGYTGPLSRHLLAYHQVTAAVRGALRDLVEMHACNMFLSNAVTRDSQPKDLSDLSFSLPFVDEPDAGLALLVKSYLDELSKNIPGVDRMDVAQWFTHAQDIQGDLAKAWRMFEAVNAGVQAADRSIVTDETKRIFSSADEWLAQKRAVDNPPNGTT